MRHSAESVAVKRKEKDLNDDLLGGAKIASGDQILDRIVESGAFKMKLNELRRVEKYKGKEQIVKLSIIMPTWNRAFIIRRAIDSVLRQSYRNYELIISDDGSLDGTEELINTEYRYDARIKYLKNPHAGVCHTRNVGLEYSTGSLIAYLDTDNVWSEHYLLLMVNSFLEHPEVDTMYCGMRVIDRVHNRQFAGVKQFGRKSLLVRNYIDMNVFMHRRKLFEKLKGFSEGLAPLEDWEFIIRYTEEKPPFVLECCLVDYYFEKEFDHVSLVENLDEAYRKIRQRYR